MNEELKTRVQELIDTMINPAVAGHGGFVELIDVQDNRVYLQMGGGCQGCGAADVTLKSGIERLIKEEIPEIAEGIVQVKAAAREPGERAKVAVMSTKRDVDPIGACVGLRGTRIQVISRELRGLAISSGTCNRL